MAVSLLTADDHSDLPTTIYVDTYRQTCTPNIPEGCGLEEYLTTRHRANHLIMNTGYRLYVLLTWTFEEYACCFVCLIRSIWI